MPLPADWPLINILTVPNLSLRVIKEFPSHRLAATGVVVGLISCK